MYCALGTQAWVRKTGLKGDGLMMGYRSLTPTVPHRALREAAGRAVGGFLQVPKARPALLGECVREGLMQEQLLRFIGLDLAPAGMLDDGKRRHRRECRGD